MNLRLRQRQYADDISEIRGTGTTTTSGEEMHSNQHMGAKRWAIVAATAGVASVAASGAMAAGYSLKEQSAALQGASFAGAAAKAEDASTIFYNPAGISRLDGYQLVQSGSYIAPVATFSDGSATRARSYGGSTISGFTVTGDAVDNAAIGSTYTTAQLSDDWHVGLAVTVPWGLITDYNMGWAGRYHALKSSMRTYNINPVVSYQVTDGFSVGAGVQIQRMSAHLTNAIDFGTIIGRPGAADGYADVKGNDWGYGFNAGLLWEPLPTTRFGLNFRSAVAHELDGTAAFTNVPNVPALRASFANTGAKARVTTPEYVMFGAYHELDPQWAVMFEASWTNWSRFKNLIITFDNPLRTPSVTQENWKDSYFTALGFEYKANEQWTLRTGLAYDSAPTPDEDRTPRIPDSDRVWASLGGTYKVNERYSVSAAYTHIWAMKADVDLHDTGAGGSNNLRGNLSGSYDAHVDIFALQISAKF